jgi:conserved oligomeric Golgi complex subunit 4
VISRLLSTGSLSGASAVFEELRDVMERDYIAIIKKKLDDVYRATGSSASHARMEKENRIAFIVSITRDSSFPSTDET